MKFNKVFVFLIVIINSTFAQSKFPQGYFIMPIAPGQATSLSGCFGDIRTNHFHAGLDIRTGGVEGKNVYAAADGYVSRIKIQNGGYGNGLYITHPNGLTTLYAHLKVFNDTLQKYLISKQYELKTWDVDLTLEPNLYKVKQGEIVALSGNTGGSAGPHLHFEIRDAKENILDPSQFGFADLNDRALPEIQFVSLKCMSADARINGKFGIFNFPVVRGKNGLHTIPQKITAKGTLGLEVLTYDRASNSPFRQGVNQINLVVNHKPVFNFRLDKMAFDNKLDMNVHVNYEKMNKTGQKIHKCYVDEGNTIEAYQTNAEKGKFIIENDSNMVELRINDAFANTIFTEFYIYKDTASQDNSTFQLNSKTQILDNFLRIDIGDKSATSLGIAYGKVLNQVPFNPETERFKIIDLKNGLPEEIKVNSTSVPLPVNTVLKINQPKKQFQNFKVNFTDALYSDVFVNFSSTDSELKLHEDIIPLKGYATIEWTKTDLPGYPDKYKAYLKGNKMKFLGGEWTNNTIKFKTREFGTIVTLYDLDPPAIAPKALTKDNLKFRISDSLSGIKKIECYVNEEWVLMDYEYKNGMIWSEKLDPSKPFLGNVVLKITDNCDNVGTFQTEITEK